MEPKGVMQRIGEHLVGGKTSTEVISMGFKSATVYRVQRRLSRRGQGSGGVPVTGNAQPAVATTNVVQQSQLETENARLQREVEDLTSQLEGTHELAQDLVDRKDELEAELRALHGQVSTLQPEASAACQLRQRVSELEGQLQHAAHTQAAMHQGAAQSQQRSEAEQAARQQAEGEASTVRQENQGLRRELGEWEQWGTKASQLVQMMYAEAKRFRPLKVWDGHRCRVCKKPMSGAVDRETAASLLEDCGHKECLETDGRGVVPWLIGGGAALYGLSKLIKK